jgi:hypothetical protein
MIKIVFPPGCYGTYLARCIYNYTDLRQEEFTPFEFSATGSSHAHRKNKNASKYIQCEHYADTFGTNSTDLIITLVPNPQHRLDYYNNQYHKQENSQLISYIQTQYTDEEIFNKLTNNWAVDGMLNESTPRWVIREWSSFWITDMWNKAYNVEAYSSVSTMCVDVNNLVESFEEVFLNLISKLELILTVDLSIITQTHTAFQNRQKFHNSQLKCEKWTNAVLNKQLMLLDHEITIFDEAYIQHLLRIAGYEIYCDNLNNFPTESTELKIFQV